MEGKTCWVCMRVGSEAYYQELREKLGYRPNVARACLAFLEETYFKYPTLLCGRKARIIKGAVAYIVGTILGEYKSQRTIMEAFTGQWQTKGMADFYRLMLLTWDGMDAVEDFLRDRGFCR